MKTALIGSILLAASAGEAGSQAVPEGVHRDAQGPAEMCGMSGQDALDLIGRVRASPALRRVTQTDRFEFYLSADDMDQWVFTRATEPAHPAVTCRHVYQDAGGSFYQTRNLRCDAGREACDRLFLEFQALDEELRRSFER